MRSFNIYFDGGADPNPGNGYGSYEIEEQLIGGGLRHREIKTQFGTCTNNEAEYLALIGALRWLFHRCEPKDTEVTIFGDSKLILGQVGGRWRVLANNLKVLRDNAWVYSKKFGKVKFKWQRRDNNVKRFGH